MSSFTIGEDDFLLDGEPYRILSGAIHYFRVHPEQWADRIRKARLMGLNTIETYVAWNAHEPVRGRWDASGPNDLGAFLDLIAAEGMHAIVRPGPYICAEWSNGGLPFWLTAMPGIGLRRSEAKYLAEVSTYLDRVYEIVAPRQIDRGGNVILVQIENEYGAYGSDKTYLAELVRLTRAAGITVPLTTVDQPQPEMLRDGSLPELHKTGSFGSRATERLAILREHQPRGPLMCSEFWDGWFDWWGGMHHVTPVSDAVVELEALLAAGASVNFYMFHGGTNFGLGNGANDKGRYLPVTTSYDYHAPLDEAGHPTEKYWAFREVIARYAEVPTEVPPPASDAPAFEVDLEPLGDWRGSAQRREERELPPTFDELGFAGALVRYEVTLDGRGGLLEFAEVRDHAWVEVDGVALGTLSRTRNDRASVIPAGSVLRVLVEDQGRVNYASHIGEAKGLIGPALLNGLPLRGWTASPLDLDAVVAALSEAAGIRSAVGPCAYRGRFSLEAPADLYLDTADWGKGFAFVNGFALGRYWRVGPQRTLYVPGPATRAGENTVLVLELEQLLRVQAVFTSRPFLGTTEE